MNHNPEARRHNDPQEKKLNPIALREMGVGASPFRDERHYIVLWNKEDASVYTPMIFQGKHRDPFEFLYKGQQSFEEFALNYFKERGLKSPKELAEQLLFQIKQFTALTFEQQIEAENAYEVNRSSQEPSTTPFDVLFDQKRLKDEFRRGTLK